MMLSVSNSEIKRKNRAHHFYHLRQRKKCQKKKLNNVWKVSLKQKLNQDVASIIFEYCQPLTCTECKSNYMFERKSLLFSPLPTVCVGCYEDCSKCVGTRVLITVWAVRMPGYHIEGEADELGILHANGCSEHTRDEDWEDQWFGWNGQRGKT